MTGGRTVNWTHDATNSPGANAPTIVGDGSQTFSSGAVTVGGFTLTNAGETPTITVTTGGVNGNTGTITVNVGTPNHVSINQDASNAVAGVAISAAITVEVRDQFENVITSDSSNTVSVAIQAVGGGGSLTGGSSETFASGVATFSNLSIDVAGTGYTLRFSYVGGGLAGANTVDTTTFSITTGSLTSGNVTPASVVAGTQTTVTVTFVVENTWATNGKLVIVLPAGYTTNASTAANNPIGDLGAATFTVAGGGTSTLTLTRQGDGNALSGTDTATFDLTLITVPQTVDNPGNFTITTQTSAGVATDSATFDPASDTITFAAANKLAVTTQPSASTVEGVAFAQQPVVTIQDAFGNTVTDSTLTVTATLQTGDGTLDGTVSLAASSGIVTYSGLSISATGTNKVLRFTQGGLQAADTTPALTITVSDAVAPTLSTATVTSNSLVLTYDETLDSGSVPAAGDFSVGTDRSPQSVESVAISGATVTLTLSPGAASGDVLTVDYTAGSNKIQDAAENTSVNLSGQTVTNNTPARIFTSTPTPAPSVEVAVDVVVAVVNEVTVATSTVEETAVTTVADDGAAAEITVPAAALEEGTTVQVAVVTNIEEIQQQAPPAVSAQVDLVLAFTVSATDSAGAAVVTNFAAPVAISFTVPAASIPAGDTEDLVVAFLGADGKWVYVTTTVTVNADGSVTLSGEVDHFTLFAVLKLVPTVLEAPPPGGISVGLSGTIDPARLAAVQTDEVQAIFVLDVLTQTYLAFVPGGLAVANTLSSANLIPDSLVTIRFAGELVVAAPTPAPAASDPVPETSPPPEEASEPEPEAVVEAVTVTVQPGETLIFIGLIVGIDWMEIAALNGISGPDYIIRPGQVLTLP